MEVLVLVTVALLALVIISIKIRQLIRVLSQNEPGGCSSCRNCSTSSCQGTKS